MTSLPSFAVLYCYPTLILYHPPQRTSHLPSLRRTAPGPTEQRLIAGYEKHVVDCLLHSTTPAASYSTAELSIYHPVLQAPTSSSPTSPHVPPPPLRGLHNQQARRAGGRAGGGRGERRGKVQTSNPSCLPYRQSVRGRPVVRLLCYRATESHGGAGREGRTPCAEEPSAPEGSSRFRRCRAVAEQWLRGRVSRDT